MAVETHGGIRVTDLAHDFADDIDITDLGIARDLPCHHHHAGFCETFAGYAAVRISCQVSIQDRIRNLVAEFIGMPFGDGLRCEQEIFDSHEMTSRGAQTITPVKRIQGVYSTLLL